MTVAELALAKNESNTEHVLDAAGHRFHIRTYRSAAVDSPILVWVHGGAFMFGGIDQPEAHQVAHYLAEAGVSVVSVDYSLAPIVPNPFAGPDGSGPPDEGPAAHEPRVRFPVASLQVVAAFDWAVKHAGELGGLPDRVSIGGASAGANLAAGAAMRLRDRGTHVPASVVLAYPLLHPTIPAFDAELAAQVAALPPELAYPEDLTRSFNLNYTGGEAGLSDAYAFPGGHDLHGFPPTLIVNADADGLRASGQTFAAELAAASVDVSVLRERGTRHGHLNEPDGPAAFRTIARFEHWLQDLLP